jgi:hypothetical protein
MTDPEVDETGKQFLMQLFEKTGGDSSVQVSMYDIGGLMGLERDAASKVAEGLIGSQLVEIRTLSGGIGISAAGSELAQDLIGPLDSATGKSARLGDEPLLNSAARQAVVQIVTEIKDQVGSLGLGFDTLTELMADLKTIDAQLESSRPKTAIVRQCFVSIGGVLKTKPNSSLNGRVTGLLGK